MKLLKIIATLTLTFIPLAAYAQECDGDYHPDTLLCPSGFDTSMPMGGCVFSG